MDGKREIEYRHDKLQGIEGILKIRHNVVRAQFTTHYPFAQNSGVHIEYYGNRLILIGQEIPDAMLHSLIGRELQDVIKMPLFEGDRSVITSAKTSSAGYSFGLKEAEPVLIDDGMVATHTTANSNENIAKAA